MELSSKYNTEIAESRLGAQQGFGTCIWQMQMLYGVFQIQVRSRGLALNKGFLPAIIDPRNVFFTYRRGVHKMHERLDNGVVCGIHVGVQGERALSVAVECLVVVGRNDPLLPTEILEAYPERSMHICLS